VAAVAESVSKAIEAVANLGKDLSPEEKKQAQPVAVAIIATQAAAAAAVAATNVRTKK
jgi:hypothetical protein